MNNIELYINGELCDVSRDFSVRLDRQLINPAELNTKDAQYSYSISLPATGKNHAVFNYSGIEEVNGKFNRDYNAELIINSVRVFKGLFRMSEISNSLYKGNLYKPDPKSIKDIFGEAKMNENPRWPLPFTDFADSVNEYNGKGASTPPAIFPYVLYGLLPKSNTTPTTLRTVWDSSVHIGISDMPPSVNVLQLIRHIFTERGYAISGSAFTDERLTNLYMSYRNDPAYIQPWNWGYQAKMQVSGAWGSSLNKRTGSTTREFEQGYRQDRVDSDNNGNGSYSVYACDLFDSTNSKIDVPLDNGGNVLNDVKEKDGRMWTQTQLRIPASGFYKVEFEASIQLRDINNFRKTDTHTGIQHVSYKSDNEVRSAFSHKQYEIRVLRDWGKGNFFNKGANLDGTFYRNNFLQNNIFYDPNNPNNGFDDDSETGNSTGSERKYFPPLLDGARLNLIDPAQDPNIVVGFAWGNRFSDVYHSLPLPPNDLPDLNYNATQIHTARPGYSWDVESGEILPRLAINCSGYWLYKQNEDDTHGYTQTDRFKITVNNAPGNYCVKQDNNITGGGRVSAVVWFDAGELLTVASVSEEGRYKVPGKASQYGWTEQEMTFNLKVTPFRTEKDWLKVDESGDGTAQMNWNDPPNFDTTSIDLVKFLPVDMKTDDFIDNLCKAFNLKLIQTDTETFQLDIKQTKVSANIADAIHLDNLASVKERTNQPLGLPSLYKLGFTIDQEEEGYSKTGYDGGGEFSTGATEIKIIEQNSTFSYNWFKDITKDGVVLPLPVISKSEVWDGGSYAEVMTKRYTNQALRFWYFDGNLNDSGTSFYFGRKSISIAKVSNEIQGQSILSYENKPFTILSNYFTILADAKSHYTIIEGYLSPDQYRLLNGSVMAFFNSDIYYIGEISGYDPTGRNKTKIKLIKKI
jgi:hypothetical protein